MLLMVVGDERNGYCIHNMKGDAVSRPFPKIEQAIAEMNTVYGAPERAAPPPAYRSKAPNSAL
jgi:hypothetical protein